jgi:DNA adenine methylase
MQYMGGKARIARRLVDLIEARHGTPARYIEPFVGAGWMFAEACARFPGVCLGGEIQPDLVALWEAVRNGWTPPDAISQAEWAALKTAEPSALRAFAGYGCSFGGKWFDGYARNRRGDDFCGAAKRGLLKRAGRIGQAPVYARDYRMWTPEPGWVVYCDPPYTGTRKLRQVSGPFDTAEFWSVCWAWARMGAHIYVSEYEAPFYATEVWSSAVKGSLAACENDRAVVERLFHLGPC